jgi:gas vesicle protein
MVNIGPKVSYFCVGLGIGAIVSLLIAPRSGEETRELIAQKMEDGKEYAQRKARELRERAEDFAGRGKNALVQQTETISAAFDAGREAYQREKAKAL